MEVVVFSNHVDKSYWLFCKEIGIALNMTVHQVHECEEADFYWQNIASNFYKMRVKEIRDKVKSGTTVRYKMLTFLKELCSKKEFRNDYESTKLNKMLMLTGW